MYDSADITKMKRGRLETIYDILTISIKGNKKTHIMYGSNMNYEGLDKYLEALIGKGLLIRDGVFYRTTDKGLDFIEKFEKIQSLLGENNKKQIMLAPSISFIKNPV